MQRDIKLGLVVGLVLLVLCGFFYIRMRASQTTEEQAGDVAVEKIIGADKSTEAKAPLEVELPKAVTPSLMTPDISPKEAASAASPTPAPVDIPPAMEEERPNAIVKLGPPSATAAGKDMEGPAKKGMAPEEEEPVTLTLPPGFTMSKTDTAGAPPATLGGEEYEVQPGDTLSDIASRTLGSAKHWRKIFEANKDQMEGPDRLIVGMKLKIPVVSMQETAPAPAPAKEPSLVPPATPEKEEKAAGEKDTHVVQKGETLSDIAGQYLNDRGKWREIAKVNPELNPDRLQIGQKIRIPKE